jgi:hypothetical protein
MHRHASAIMRDYDPALASRNQKDLRVPPPDDIALKGGLEINGGFSPAKASNDLLIEILVS